MIRAINLKILQKNFPEFSLGVSDYRAGRWTDIASHDRSFVYELGRLFAQESVPGQRPDHGSGFISLSPYLERSIKEICG